MAKTANNKSQPGKAGTGGKPAKAAKASSKTSKTPAKAGKAPAKRTDTKPARGKAAQRSQPRGGKQGERRGLVKFLREVRIELGKVAWPTRKELLQSTIVVLVAVAIAAVYTFAIDSVFSRTVETVISIIT